MQNSTSQIQKDIIESLKEIFKDTLLKNSHGEEVPLEFYCQEVPYPTHDDDSKPYAPFCLVQILDCTFRDWNYTRELSVGIIFRIFDASSTREGSNTIMDLLDTAFSYYAKHTSIGNAQIITPIECTLQLDVNTYPFQYGAMQLNLECAGEKIELDDLT